MSKEEFARMMPVRPPMVNKNTNPSAQRRGVSKEN